MRAVRQALLLLLAATAAAKDEDYDYVYDASQHQTCVPAGSRTVEIRCAPENGEAVCHGYGARQHPPTLRFGLPVAPGNTTENIQAPYCASLLTLERGGQGECYERLSFRNYTAGWADDSPDEDGDLVIYVSLLSTIGVVKQVAFSSSASEFWDFTHPDYSAESGFLTAVTFNQKAGERAPCDISLANIYNLGGTSIEELSIYNNKNNDTDLRIGPMPKLKVLRLVDCSLQNFPADAHIQMPALDSLFLENNQLTSVPATIAGMQKLKILDLSGARLQRLAGQLPPLPQLAVLMLANTELCCLHQEQDALQGVPNLLALDISQNQLTSLGSALSGLHQLNFLDASNNQLVEYPELQLQDEALLSFTDNHLDTIPHCDQFGTNSSRLTLELQNSQISHWNGGPNMLRCVDSLNLANNSLTNINSSMLASLDVLKSVHLDGNPLHCEGCAFEQLRTWLRTTQVEVWAGGNSTGAATALLCATPPAFRGMSVGAVPVGSNADECDTTTAADPASSDQHSQLLVVGLSLGAVLLVLLLLAAAACYRYRFELAYSAHLLQLRARARSSRSKGHLHAGDAFLFDAFILYSGSDQSWVGGTLVTLLESEPRYRVCLHERGLDSGAAKHNFSHLMDSSRHVIVVLSKSFLNSRWCLWEMDLANHRALDPSLCDYVILLEMEPLERSALPRHLRFLMDTRTYLEWHQEGEAQCEQQAFARLQQALGPPGSAAHNSVHAVTQQDTKL